MQRADERLAAHNEQHIQEWAEGVYELFKAHHVELISFVTDGGHKRLIACCQSTSRRSARYEPSRCLMPRKYERRIQTTTQVDLELEKRGRDRGGYRPSPSRF